MQNKFLRSELTKGSSFSCLFFNLALFSFQDAVFVVLRGFILSRRLIYYTTFSEVCQVFFQSFLKNFFQNCSEFVVFRIALCCTSRSACKLFYYTTFSEVCQEVFQIFFEVSLADFAVFIVPASLCDSRPAWQRTCLLYHIFGSLSSAFSKFLLTFHLTSFSSNCFRLFNFL